MNKRINIVIFMLGCFFLMISSTSALTLSCDVISSIGEVVKCHVKDDEYIGIKANYKIGEEFLYKGFKVKSSWKNYYAGNLGFSLGNVVADSGLDAEVFLEVSDKAINNSVYTVTLTNIEVVDKSYTSVKLDDVSSEVKILSNENRLKSLNVSNGELSPKFNSDVTSYKVSIDSDKIVIEAVAIDEGAKISGDVGEKTLAYGVNYFVISVTSVRGEVRNYYLYVTRELKEIKKSNDFTLKSLTFNGRNIKLEKDIYVYDIDVSNEVNEMDIEVVLSSDKASYDILKPDSLVVGENNIVINVTAEDGSIGKYVLVVNKLEKVSKDATIKSLKIKGYELDFDSNIYFYDLNIGAEDELEFDIVLNSDKAKYTISGNNNLVNKSIINIEVVAEDGSYLNYRIRVFMEDVNNSGVIGKGVSLVILVSLVVLVTLVLVVKVIKDKSLVIDE